MQKVGLNPFIHPTSSSKQLDISENFAKTKWKLVLPDTCMFSKEWLRSLAQDVELYGTTASTTML